MVQRLEFLIVDVTSDLAAHVGPLEVLNSLDDAINVLLLLKVDLLLRTECQDLVQVSFHFPL